MPLVDIDIPWLDFQSSSSEAFSQFLIAETGQLGLASILASVTKKGTEHDLWTNAKPDSAKYGL